MGTTVNGSPEQGQWIEIEKDGPYVVHGHIPLVRKTQIVSEYGEPLTWQKGETIKTDETYCLCRCGQSKDKPFCDASHCEVFFDGTEAADPGVTAQRQIVYRGTGIVVKKDPSLCMLSGFCGNRLTNIEGMMANSGDPQVRAQIIAMIERCPSGSYTYALAEDGADVEPDLPPQIALTTEITDQGPIPGPLWVSGNIPIRRADGQPFETRNRVTLCNCGRSACKPLCDGTHRRAATENDQTG